MKLPKRDIPLDPSVSKSLHHLQKGSPFMSRAFFDMGLLHAERNGIDLLQCLDKLNPKQSIQGKDLHPKAFQHFLKKYKSNKQFNVPKMINAAIAYYIQEEKDWSNKLMHEKSTSKVDASGNPKASYEISLYPEIDRAVATLMQRNAPLFKVLVNKSLAFAYEKKVDLMDIHKEQFPDRDIDAKNRLLVIFDDEKRKILASLKKKYNQESVSQLMNIVLMNLFKEPQDKFMDAFQHWFVTRQEGVFGKDSPLVARGSKSKLGDKLSEAVKDQDPSLN